MVQSWINTCVFLSDQCKEIIHNPVIGLFYFLRNHLSIIHYVRNSVPFNFISNYFVLFTAMCYN